MAAEAPLAPRNKSSLATARVVPAVLALLVAYVTYVVIGPLTINYLLNAPQDVRPRIATGIATPIVWLFLLIPVAATYLRLLLVVFRGPGYISQGDDELKKEPSPDFWTRDVFVCDANGHPIWCYYCRNWKPDRAHHNQDVGRCTLKMDHFCPWVRTGRGPVNGKEEQEAIRKCSRESRNVGLLVADTSFRLVASLASDRSSSSYSFSYAGMGWTTIEQAGRGNSFHLAVLLPPELQAALNGSAPTAPPSALSRGNDHFTSELDDPSHSSYFSNTNTKNWALRRASRSEYWRGTITYPLTLPTDRPPLPAPQPRTFAILETPPGMNPWDLGSTSRNVTSVFGTKLHHWVLPVRHSPCCDHSSDVSFYPLGPQFEDFLEDAGLVQSPPPRSAGKESYARGSTVSEKRRRKRALERGWQHGERPDGWWMEKEERRRRKEERRRAREEGRDGDVVR
ncbi:Palmitoyltransferase pfa5 [Friedmanniomyces endolithicus]|nr:Palmitoyltransferase pfa5 [Friedmanniomyces endolithicus]